MNDEEPSVLTRMRLSCCWGDNLNKKELNEIVDYINHLQQENKKYKEVIDKAIDFIDMHMYEDYCYVGSEDRLKEILNEVM